MQGVGRRAMPAASLEKDEVEFLHQSDCATRHECRGKKTVRLTHVFHGCHRTVAVSRLQVRVYDARCHPDPYLRPRPYPDAVRQPLVCTALDSRLDAVRDARRRWMALV